MNKLSNIHEWNKAYDGELTILLNGIQMAIFNPVRNNVNTFEHEDIHMQKESVM